MNISTSDASVSPKATQHYDAEQTGGDRAQTDCRANSVHRPALARADREPAAIEPAAIIQAVIK